VAAARAAKIGARGSPALFGGQALTPYQAPYNAVGDCSTNDAAALSSASAAAVKAGQPVLIDRCYRISTTETLAANLLFKDGGSFSVDKTVTLTLTGQISASEVTQIFSGAGNTVASGASFVSVAWWGAISAADPAAAFRAALGSGRTYYVPPFNYTFQSFTTGFIGATPPGPGLVSTPVFVNGLNHFNVSAYGATFSINQTAGGPQLGGCSCMFVLNNNRDFTWSGGTYVGTKAGLTSGATNAAFVNHNAVDFVFRDIHLSGNFGSPYNGGGGSGFVGTFQVNGLYQNITMDAVGLGFDYAFLTHVTFDNITCHGAGWMVEREPATGGSRAYPSYTIYHQSPPRIITLREYL
jgi:hypothetical protein